MLLFLSLNNISVQFPPLQVPVNPIQSAGDVGGISTFGEEKIIFRRQKQRARLRKRADEWWRAGGGTHEVIITNEHIIAGGKPSHTPTPSAPNKRSPFVNINPPPPPDQ